MASAAGQVEIDFGAFPGKPDVSLNVASPEVEVGSYIQAWLRCEDTADHTSDEHAVNGPRIEARINAAHTGITILAFGRCDVPPPGGTPVGYQYHCYGKWLVEWSHN